MANFTFARDTTRQHPRSLTLTIPAAVTADAESMPLPAEPASAERMHPCPDHAEGAHASQMRQGLKTIKAGDKNGNRCSVRTLFAVDTTLPTARRHRGQIRPYSPAAGSRSASVIAAPATRIAATGTSLDHEGLPMGAATPSAPDHHEEADGLRDATSDNQRGRTLPADADVTSAQGTPAGHCPGNGHAVDAGDEPGPSGAPKAPAPLTLRVADTAEASR